MSETIRMAEEFVAYIVRSIADDPDCFHITSSVDERGVLLSLSVDTEEFGRVVGRKGSTAQSMRTLLRALGMRNSAIYYLKIEEWNHPNE